MKLIFIQLQYNPFIGAGLGLGTGMIQDIWQLGIGNQMADEQMGRNKHMMNFQMEKQMEMWERTGYKAQVEQLKKAGLNPALLYGMSGGGGQTAAGPTATTPMPSTPQHDNVGMGLQAGIQMQLLQAQKANIEADTEKKKVEAGKTSGVDTQEATARIDLIAQQTDNAAQQHQILKLDITLKNIENFEKQQTQADRLRQISLATQEAGKRLAIITNDAQISDATKDELIKITQQKLIGAALTNGLTATQIGATATAQALDQQKIKESINDIMLKWQSLGNEQQKTLLQNLETQFNTDPVNRMTDQISRLIDNIFFITSKTPAEVKRNPIGFK